MWIITIEVIPNQTQMRYDNETTAQVYFIEDEKLAKKDVKKLKF